MLKPNDAIIIFAIFAAAGGVLILSSNTTTMVFVAALAAVFGAMLGKRLRKSPTDDDSETAAAEPAAASPTPGDTSAKSGVPAKATANQAEAPMPARHDPPADGATPATAVMAADRSAPHTEPAAPSQMALLKNLVASVSEGITFKDPQGRYISANAAFAQMLDSRPSEIVGRDDAGVFGHLTAQTLLASDDAAAANGRISTTLEVPLPNGPRYFEITKASVNNEEDSLEGIVAVWRDVTEPSLHRLRREKAMRETIMAFTRSIELRDAHLGNQAQRLAYMAASVADVMELDDDIATTVELAAYLSQVGKLGVDANLLNQQRRFTEQEIKEMQKHVHHTARLLQDLDFGLPVAATLFQMHERLDGTGYPQGLNGSDIALPARILGACDVFCARTALRSYRPAIAADAALDILLQNPHRYDETVVRAMQEVIKLPESAEILA